MYKKAFHPSFKKDIKDLPKELVETVRKATDEIAINPYLYNKLSGSFSECFKYKLKANRVEYRIIFTTENSTVIFIMIKKRENIYSYLKRRLSK